MHPANPVGMANYFYYHTDPPVTSQIQHQEHVFRMYAHQQFGSNESIVVAPNLANCFGATNVLDWDIRDGPNINAKVVGRLQGLGMMTGKSNQNWINSSIIVFTDERFVGSTLNVQGNFGPPYILGMPNLEEGQWTVLGGTGQFAYAQGIVTCKRFQVSNAGSVIELHIRVVCLTFPKPSPAPPQKKDYELQEGAVKVGPWGPPGGQPHDISSQSKPQRLVSIRICSHQGCIQGLSFTYVDQKGDPINAGNWGKFLPGLIKDISLTPGEHLNHVSGTVNNSGVTSLKLATNKSEYGPFGCRAGNAFDMPLQKGKGEVVAFFGRSGDTLRALGVYVPHGKKGSPVKVGTWGGSSGLPQDINTSKNEPAKLKSLTVHSSQFGGGRVYGFSFTYIDQNGQSIPVAPWGKTSGQENAFTMNQGEYVNKITGSFDDYGVTMLKFTTNQNEYGPFGCRSGTSFSVELPDNSTEDGVDKQNGAVVAFFGNSGDSLVAIGAYIGVAPKPEP